MREPRCQDCSLVEAACYCRRLPVAAAACGIRIVVVRHVGEHGRASGTAHLIPRLVPGAEILPYGGLGEPFAPGQIPETGGQLLFPDGAWRPPEKPPETLIVLDGTWRQARRMRRRIPELRGTPVLSLPPAPPCTPLRKPRWPGELPTAMAVAWALELLGEPAAAETLRHGYSLQLESCQKLGRYRAAG